MKIAYSGIAALLVSTAPVFAGGIERAPQSLSALFEEGNYAELSFGAADPTVEGTDTLGVSTGDVANGYGFFGLAYKHQFNQNLSGVLIVEQPYGADLTYESALTGGSPLLGGTAVDVDSTTYTALLRYKFDNNMSFHGGIRGSYADGNVTLDGAAYGAVAGYNVDLDGAWGVGYVVGAAYEIPEYAARISLTYHSKIDHDFDTTETGPLIPTPIGDLPLLDGDSTTTVSTPEAVNLEFQTGVAADTLVFGSVRWVNWSEFLVDPQNFTAVTGEGLVELEDTTTYTIGVGRQFTEAWAGSAAFTYEPEGDDLVSPLAPTNGRMGITLAAIYTMDNMKITTGINYSKLGDAMPETADTARASMEDNDLWGIGVRVGYSF
ncbi:outer membrane protein transport protein [Paracoccus sp. Z330]|uniref:Outer membrane protein transport protein n=1 Tax=Paracoccus onchidii TaxID=3017813 RepID=A0ABT4Z9U2_9RHOB|nr:outer membrane protein transport protein [Paracoccus onchidii]MDB6176015.1 outer membrane protein transport protein [Paracoccus onchidii]